MKLKLMAFALLISIVLAGCSGKGSDQGKAANENGTQNIKKVVQDFSAGNGKNKSASITSQQLIVTNSDNTQSVYNLPKKEFFVSIAPYVNQTHP